MRGAVVTVALALVGGALFGSFQTPSSAANVIHVELTGFRNDKGRAWCALHSSAKDFPKNAGKTAVLRNVAIVSGHAGCDFADVPAGTYAVSVFHDENNNGKLDTNLLGIPREGVGASNDAKGHFGPPKFSNAAFRYSGGLLNLVIRITYL